MVTSPSLSAWRLSVGPRLLCVDHALADNMDLLPLFDFGEGVLRCAASRTYEILCLPFFLRFLLPDGAGFFTMQSFLSFLFFLVDDPL